MCFLWPAGLGKTTLCGIIANEMGVNLKVTSGPAIESGRDGCDLKQSPGGRCPVCG